MKIYENITYIIKEKALTKKEFAQKLINLSPKTNRLSETPTISTIYGYLNGRINIPIDLVPYIADALEITEQELFDNSPTTIKRCFKAFLENASEKELEQFQNLINFQIKNYINVNYNKMVINDKTMNEDMQEFARLLKFAPISFMGKVLSKLKEYEKMDNFIL